MTILRWLIVKELFIEEELKEWTNGNPNMPLKQKIEHWPMQ